MTTHTLPEALQRRPDEPSGAHRALVDYAILGVARSICWLSGTDLPPIYPRRVAGVRNGGTCPENTE